MNKKQKAFVLLLLVFLLIPSLTFAHAGKTDEFGGHYDYNTGEYHYHHGYPAHQHTDGICPYDFDDKTNHDSSSGSGSSSSNRSEYTTETTTERITGTTSSSNTDKKNSTSNKEDKKPMTAFTKFAIFYIVISLIIIAVLIYFLKDKTNFNKSLEKENLEFKDELRHTKLELHQANDVIRTLVENRSLYQISNVPPDTKIQIDSNGNYIIEQKEHNEYYGKYTAYVSNSGYAYHMRFGCSGAVIPICLFDKNMAGNRLPCSKCCGSSVDDELLIEPKWFTIYTKTKIYYDRYLSNDTNKNEENDKFFYKANEKLILCNHCGNIQDYARSKHIGRCLVCGEIIDYNQKEQLKDNEE